MLSISMATSIGLVAGCLSSWSLVPQLLKCWRDGLTEAVSKKMFATRAFGLVLWVVYGFFAGSPPVVIFSSINLVLSITTSPHSTKLVTSRSSHRLDASAVVSIRSSKCTKTAARPNSQGNLKIKLCLSNRPSCRRALAVVELVPPSRRLSCDGHRVSPASKYPSRDRRTIQLIVNTRWRA